MFAVLILQFSRAHAAANSLPSPLREQSRPPLPFSPRQAVAVPCLSTAGAQPYRGRHPLLTLANLFCPFPPSFPLQPKPPLSPPLPAKGELLLSPFRPSPSLFLPTTTLPRCALLGNTFRRRRRRLPTTEAPAPCLSTSLCLLVLKKKRNEGRRRREGKIKRKEDSLTGGPLHSVSSYFLYLIQIQSLEAYIS
uniref:Uncharacterized protein n=1 Tax=Oryza meridionalis TaxID=40149 RepID=A0A0E0DJP0_9ORYZ